MFKSGVHRPRTSTFWQLHPFAALLTRGTLTTWGPVACIIEQIFQLLLPVMHETDQLALLVVMCVLAPFFNWANSLLVKEKPTSEDPARAPRYDASRTRKRVFTIFPEAACVHVLRQLGASFPCTSILWVDLPCWLSEIVRIISRA